MTNCRSYVPFSHDHLPGRNASSCACSQPFRDDSDGPHAPPVVPACLRYRPKVYSALRVSSLLVFLFVHTGSVKLFACRVGITETDTRFQSEVSQWREWATLAAGPCLARK